MNKLGIALASLSLLISTGAQAASATRSAQALPASSKVAPVAERASAVTSDESEFAGIPLLPLFILIAIIIGATWTVVDDNDSPG